LLGIVCRESRQAFRAERYKTSTRRRAI
jgi:hypothetical protein